MSDAGSRSSHQLREKSSQLGYFRPTPQKIRKHVKAGLLETAEQSLFTFRQPECSNAAPETAVRRRCSAATLNKTHVSSNVAG
jgi:hypothetical protein